MFKGLSNTFPSGGTIVSLWMKFLYSKLLGTCSCAAVYDTVKVILTFEYTEESHKSVH